MANINKNIIMQAGAAVANATNKAAGLSASTPEPGSIISAIQLVNGGRTIGPDALAHFTESVRNKLLSLLVSMEPIQSGSGTPAPDNVRPISGRTGLTIYVSPTPTAADATTYAVDWTTPAGTVYGGTVDVVTGVLTVDRASRVLDGTEAGWQMNVNANHPGRTYAYNRNASLGDILTSNSIMSSYVPSATFSGTDENSGIYVDAGYLWVRTPPMREMTAVADWTTYLSNNPLQVCYELATPLTYQLTAQDIITLVGDNYIWSDSGDVTITE